MNKIILLLLTLTCFTSYAAIYMQEDKSGHITYSDTPKNDSQPVSLTPVNSVSPTNKQTNNNTPHASTTSNKNQPAAQGNKAEDDQPTYTSFTITSPTDKESIQNQASFMVKTTSEPQLQPGDTTQLFIDGQAWGEPTASADITVENLMRGEHTLFVKLLDKSQQVVKQTRSITVFVHQASTNFRSRA